VEVELLVLVAHKMAHQQAEVQAAVALTLMQANKQAQVDIVDKVFQEAMVLILVVTQLVAVAVAVQEQLAQAHQVVLRQVQEELAQVVP
jgi:hypothetical protein